MKKIELVQIPEDIYLEIGKLILLFSHVEWLIANIVLLCEIPPTVYANIKDLSITQNYFKVLLGLNFSKKINRLSDLGFNTSKLKEVGKYRNTFSHGIIFDGAGSLILKRLSNPSSIGIELQKDHILENIETLKEEAGKLIDFLESKGYKIHESEPKKD